MPPTRSQQPAALISATWIRDERQQANSLIAQEVEEFAFSARNEAEWLNEHMADVLAKRNFDVAEMFKTPGKLRGKTPRTVRRRASSQDRAPLTDVFTSNTPVATSPLRPNQFYRNIARFQVAEDKVDQEVVTVGTSRVSMDPGKENTDSGYHDMTLEDVEEERLHSNQAKSEELSLVAPPSLQKNLSSPSMELSPVKAEITDLLGVSTTSERPNELALSFVSAREEVDASDSIIEIVPREDPVPLQDDREPDDSTIPQKAVLPLGTFSRPSDHFCVSAETAAALNNALDDAENEITVCPTEPVETEDFPSDTPSPARTVLRKKSSLTFATLPAREPLTTKKNLETFVSRLSHHDHNRFNTGLRESYLGRPSSKYDLLPQTDFEVAGDVKNEDQVQSPNTTPKPESVLVKSSTQRLQERITLLGKANAPKPLKSIPFASTAMEQIELSIPQGHPSHLPIVASTGSEDIDDDWIGPIKEHSPSRSGLKDVVEVAQVPYISTTSSSSAVAVLPTPSIEKPESAAQDIVVPDQMVVSYPQIPMSSVTPSRTEIHRKPVLTSYPSLGKVPTESKNPVGSPGNRKNLEGPISASKAKFYSVLKSAKGIFASSAGVSAQAKLETLAEPPSRSKVDLTHANPNNVLSQASPVYTNLPLYPELQGRSVQENELIALGSPKKLKTPNKVRRSSERIEKHKEKLVLDVKTRQQVAEDLERIRDAEKQKAALQRLELEKSLHQPTTRQAKEPAMITTDDEEVDQPPVPPPKTLSMAQSAAKAAELRRPTRLNESDSSRTQPAPMSIRVASQRIRQAPPSNTVLAASLQESLVPPVLAPTRPALTKKTSSSSLTAVASSQGMKAAASRPKALEAAARKKEADDRETQRKAVNKRELERKRTAKLEEERRVAQEQKATEQQRLLDLKLAAQKQAAERKAETLRKAEQQRLQAASRSRIDDPFSQSQEPGNLQGRTAVPHVNPAKPLKRFHQADDDEEPLAQASSQKPGPSMLGNAPKRRRTSEIEINELPARSTMAPPVRLSAMRKEGQSKFGPSYGMSALSHNVPSMLKTAVTTQHHLTHPKTPHMNDLAKTSNTRIPFAEQPNGPAMGSQQQGYRSLAAGKTPATIHKSSPQYPNGDSIELPDIATDSDDSDDEKDFKPPDWANSPALKELLAQQQLVDPMKVFGPIAPLMMEEVFKGNKERQAKFRARTSSANWNGPDRLTEEERRRDFEARERLERDGGWTFNGSV